MRDLPPDATKLVWDALLGGRELVPDAFANDRIINVLADGARDPRVAALVAEVEQALRDPSSAPRGGPWSGLVGSVWFRATETWPARLRHLHEWLLMPRPPVGRARAGSGARRRSAAP